MSSTSTIELKSIDPEDIGDLLLAVEKPFEFQFADGDLKDVKTFGELCDIRRTLNLFAFCETILS